MKQQWVYDEGLRYLSPRGLQLIHQCGDGGVRLRRLLLCVETQRDAAVTRRTPTELCSPEADAQCTSALRLGTFPVPWGSTDLCR